MPKYKCINDQCSFFDKEVTVERVKMLYNKLTDQMEPKDPIVCKDCKQDLAYIKQGGEITCHFNSFSSMNPQQKREVLHKRSQDHFKKTDKGDLNNYKKTMTDNLRRQAEGRS